MEAIQVGDVVAIRGDFRKNSRGQCMYTEDQLVQGKYLKHTGHGGIWIGVVKSLREDLVILSSGGAWAKGLCEVMYKTRRTYGY